MNFSGYFKCSQCGNKWSAISRDFKVNGCPICGGSLKISIGGMKPGWYSGPEAQEQNPKKAWWAFWR